MRKLIAVTLILAACGGGGPRFAWECPEGFSYIEKRESDLEVGIDLQTGDLAMVPTSSTIRLCVKVLEDGSTELVDPIRVKVND